MSTEGTILAPADHERFRAQGYVVIPNAVPAENCAAVVDAVWEFLGMDPEDPSDWYREPHRTGSMVEMYHHPSMWANRQHPRVYQIFREILGTERLWVSMDRVSMKPPSHPDHPEYASAGFTHWDVDLDEAPPRFGVQGVLALTDTDANMGGFQCVPGCHQRFKEIGAQLTPEEKARRRPDLSRPEFADLKVTPIPMKQGDLLVWNRLLLHGNGLNASDRPRLAQYLTMSPSRERDEAYRQRRIEMWRKRLCPSGRAFPGDPRRLEELHGETPELTPLGRKLLGLDLWPAD